MLNQTLLVLTFSVFVSLNNVIAQNQYRPVAEKALSFQQNFKSMEQQAVFQLADPQSVVKSAVNEVVNSATFLTPTEVVKQIQKESPSLLSLKFPFTGGKTLDVQLFKAESVTKSSIIRTISNNMITNSGSTGVYYWGIVKDDPNSLVALSIMGSEIMGFISQEGEQYTIGKLDKSASMTHILYKESNLKIAPTHSCGTDDHAHDMGNGVSFDQAAEKSSDNCVRIYVEVDYDVYEEKGSVTATTDYVLGAFAQVAALYANESINMTVSELLIWDVKDPYEGPSAINYLKDFRDQLNGNFNGDIAHLVGYNGFGGVAYVNTLCNKKYSVGYSGLAPYYNDVPTYSWTVEVLAHEIGHNLGSKHTHACVWNGNNTAIDGCGPAAGADEGCNAPLPIKGTIMSYCHLLSGVGIDFGLGFGQQPGDLLRDKVYNAPCLSSCNPVYLADAGIESILSPNGDLCEHTIAPQVLLKNHGTEKLTDATIFFQLDGQLPQTTFWTGALPAGQTETFTLPLITFGNGTHVLQVKTMNPNGMPDNVPFNDDASTSFFKAEGQTMYADLDGDGFGDPANAIYTCDLPAGYVLDASDCDDNNGQSFPGAACNDGDDCTINDTMNDQCNCFGTFMDSDDDSICDAEDQCPGFDDLLDVDNDGIPDACDVSECEFEHVTWFDEPWLQQTGEFANSTTVFFPSENQGAHFNIMGLRARAWGEWQYRFVDVVTITYVDGSGQEKEYGTFSGNDMKQVLVDITGVVQSVTVSLINEIENDYLVWVYINEVHSCSPYGELVQNQTEEKEKIFFEATVFPNPAIDEVFIKFNEVPASASITFSTILGQPVAYHEMSRQSAKLIDLRQLAVHEQMLLVTVEIEGQRPVTEQLFVSN